MEFYHSDRTKGVYDSMYLSSVEWLTLFCIVPSVNYGNVLLLESEDVVYF